MSGIEVDHCMTCNGRWLDHHQLDEFEATIVPDPSIRRATIEFSRRESGLSCPVCQKQMRAFNYRAYAVEIDTCEDEHGWWLDAGEEGLMRDVLEDRVRGLQRAATAEEAWGDLIRGVSGGGVWDRVKDMFRGNRK